MTRSPRLRLAAFVVVVSALALICLIGSARAGNLGVPHFGGDVRNGGVNDPNLYIQPQSVTADKLAAGVAAANLGFAPLSAAQNLADLPNPALARFYLGIGSPVQFADIQPGLDYCSKVQFAAALLPGGHGTVDARGLPGAQTCAMGLNIAADNFTLLAGSTVLSVGAEMQFNGQNDGIICPESGGYLSGATGPTVIQQAPGANLPVVIYFAKGRPNISGGCVIDGNKAANTSGVAVVQAKSSQGVIRGAVIENGPGDNFECISTLSNNQCQQWNILQAHFVFAAKRNLYCYGGADSMVNSSFFENAGGAGIELDNCPTWRLVNYDVGGNGKHGFAGPQGIDFGGNAPGIYVHGFPYMPGLYLWARGVEVGVGNIGNNYGQDILVDGSSPTNVATLGGAVTIGDVVSVTFSGGYLNGGVPVVVSYTAQAGDSLTSVAAALAGLINANATLIGYEMGASASGGVLTIYNPAYITKVSTPGAAPSATTVSLSSSVSGSQTETVAWSTGSAGTAAPNTHILGPEILGSVNRASNLFYPIEIYNNATGGDHIEGVTLFSTTSPADCAGIILIHGTSGYDLVSGVEAAGAFGSSLWSVLVNVPSTTQVANVCATVMNGCFSTSPTFTSNAAGTNAGTFQTQGASAADSNAINLSNPSAASYSVVQLNMSLGGSQTATLSATHELGGPVSRLLLSGLSNTSTWTPLWFGEAYTPTIVGCSWTNQTKSQPQGEATLSAACSNQNVTITYQAQAHVGYRCGDLLDMTSGVSFKQSARTNASATFNNVSGASGDVFLLPFCAPY